MILAGPPRAVPLSSPDGSPNASTSDVVGSLMQTRGGSYILGRKEAGAWEPGSAIVRPDNTAGTQVICIPLPASSPAAISQASSSVSAAGSAGGGAAAGAGANASSSSSSSYMLRVSYACHSKQGRSPRPPIKPNQDSFLAMHGLGNDPSVAMFAVFDGHGPRGEEASQFARVNLPDVCVRNPQFVTHPEEAFASAFETLHRRFVSPATAKTGVDVSVSGTTAVGIMLHGGAWVCANVGDSRAMVAARNAHFGLVAKALSSDHKPQRPDERARISRTGAKILSEKQLGIEGEFYLKIKSKQRMV